MRWAESSTNKITPARKPVMLNGVLAWPSCLILNWTRDADLDLVIPDRFHIRNPDLFLFLLYLSGKWVMPALEIIKAVAGSKGELILYFKSKFWAWVGKLRADSVHRVVIYSLRPLSKLRRARFKIVYAGRKFVQVESRNLFSPVSKWIVRVRIWHLCNFHNKGFNNFRKSDQRGPKTYKSRQIGTNIWDSVLPSITLPGAKSLTFSSH